MTREEAIIYLKQADVTVGRDIKTKTAEALEMAIKALEHPERNVIAVVPCGDAISRSDVLKLMQDNWHTHNGDWAMQESMDDIRALPSVTPQEPKIGHWIRITNGAMKEKYICSECGRQVENDGIESLLPIKYPYCHCGAKMVESQESEK